MRSLTEQVVASVTPDDRDSRPRGAEHGNTLLGRKGSQKQTMGKGKKNLRKYKLEIPYCSVTKGKRDPM